MEGNPPRKANFPTRCHRHQQEKNMLFLGRFFLSGSRAKSFANLPTAGRGSIPIWYKIYKCIYIYGGFLKCCYPTTMGFPTTNDHFGVFWGYHHLRKHPYLYIYIGIIFGLIVVTSHDRIHQNDLISRYLELVKFISTNHHPDICMETCVACMCNYGMTWAPKKVAEEGKSPYFTKIYLGEIS